MFYMKEHSDYCRGGSIGTLMMALWIIENGKADRSIPSEEILEILTKAWRCDWKDGSIQLNATQGKEYWLQDSLLATLLMLEVLKGKLRVLQHSLNSDLPAEDRDFLLLRTIQQFFCMEHLWIPGLSIISSHVVSVILCQRFRLHYKESTRFGLYL